MSAMPTLERRIRDALRPIKDYPKPGIVFQDITPVLADAGLLHDVIAAMAQPFAASGVSHVVGIEARGFILGGAVASALRAGFVPVRKPGKLPWERVKEEYLLEYGTDALEAHRDGLAPGHRVLIVDDVLATGGTAEAAARLARKLGSEVAGWSFLLEISFLRGRDRLTGAPSAILATV
ncbi:MAG TPA: adenine phosphoribosyltransferase [Gemmatimonadales bacterium]|nr:adenine phosphoribosyltransferase [Gemmatimonadales bacterium]